jgi:hypothetical protein
MRNEGRICEAGAYPGVTEGRVQILEDG